MGSSYDAPGVPLRQRVPILAALATAIVGAINVCSAVTPELPGRVQSLLALAPLREMALAHALALPAGIALVLSALPLAGRRRRALRVAVALLALLGLLNVAKGLDVEEALLSSTLAIVLWRSRAAFWVRHDPPCLRTVARRSAVAFGGAMTAATLALLFAGDAVAPAASPAATPARALALLASQTGDVAVDPPFAWLPLALGALGVTALCVALAGLLVPARPRTSVRPGDRRRAAALVRRHGTDTLSPFTLRADVPRCWSPDGLAFAGYRIEAGTLLLGGDPVGPPASIDALVAETLTFARHHGLRLGAVGASESFSAAAAGHGLRRMYLGDEAIVPTGAMDLRGRRRKKLRNAQHRVGRAGYRAEALRIADIDPPTLAALEAISERWRAGAPERGFSMAHDRLADELVPEALVVVALDADDRPRAFLQFMPVFGRPVMSLGFMRRDRDTPNGVIDFLVVESARILGEAGIEEFSLNFAAFGRWLRTPSTPAERLAGHVLRVADRWFQLQRLVDFTAKFEPRWEPRYLLFDGAAALPRAALGAMWAEGQLPRPGRAATPAPTHGSEPVTA